VYQRKQPPNLLVCDQSSSASTHRNPLGLIVNVREFCLSSVEPYYCRPSYFVQWTRIALISPTGRFMSAGMTAKRKTWTPSGATRNTHCAWPASCAPHRSEERRVGKE